MWKENWKGRVRVRKVQREGEGKKGVDSYSVREKDRKRAAMAGAPQQLFLDTDLGSAYLHKSPIVRSKADNAKTDFGSVHMGRRRTALQ